MELTATASNAVTEISGTPEEPQSKSYIFETETAGLPVFYSAVTATPSDALPVSPESFPMLYEILFVVVFILFFLCGILLEKVLFRRM